MLQGEQVMLEEALLMLWLESKKVILFIWSLLDICVWSLLQGEQVMLEEAVLMLWLESKKKGTDQLMDQFRQLQPGTQVRLLNIAKKLFCQ